jgi:ATP-dependent Lon protease
MKKKDDVTRQEAEQEQTGSDVTEEHFDFESEILPAIPEDVLIIIPVRNMVMFPGVVLPIMLGREVSIAAAKEALQNKRKIGLVLQRDPNAENPTPADLYSVGTSASILRYVAVASDSHHMICQGEQRFKIYDFIEGYPFLLARVESIKERIEINNEIEAREHRLKTLALEGLELLPQAPAELGNAIQNVSSPSILADMVTSFIDIEPTQKQEVLEKIDLQSRLDMVLTHLSHRVEVLRLSNKIDQETKEHMDERQREYILREQMRTIQKELGDDEEGAEITELKQAIIDAKMTEESEEQALKELKRLEKMPDSSAEYSMIRTYLDWLIELPWSKTSEESIDIDRARKILDEDHYGLDKVKKRILEYLAVRKLNPDGKSPILCFVGPPGVGKTSLGQSIARAIGLEFVRASLGGTHDEAEIRGHRRTYIGALPGKIIQNIRRVGTRNPVFMLDEMDKLGSSYHGDPSSALLEVLDPEQNFSFQDNYLGLYIEDEKFEIAKRYLVKRQLEQNGLKEGQVTLSEEALRSIIHDYTREAGCRNLEREIGAVFRHVAVKVAEGMVESAMIEKDDLHDILGVVKYESEVAMRTSLPGVATGLAWTPTGGDILFIESSKIPGNGKLILTGHLGDVMKESAQAALSLVKSRAEELGIDQEVFEKSDIHIHVPAGAIPKDGPSAGVAMFASLVSLFADKKIKNDIAMTGEISLRGLVLPVGGIKEKIVAAARAGIKTVMLPKRNKRDYDDIPEIAREQLEFIWLERVGDAIDAALEK